MWYVDLAYDSLIETNTADAPVPGLASSWSMSSDNKTLTVQIAPGRKFSDGSSVTPQAVVNSIDFFKKNSTGPNAGPLQAMTVKTVGSDGVAITSATPNPDLIYYFEPHGFAGAIISPTGIAHPSELSSASFGSGPYVLDAAETQSGSQYVFTPDKYADQSAIHFQSVTIKIFHTNQSMALALKTGQIDAMQGDEPTVSIAQSAGDKVLTRLSSWQGPIIMDRSGKNVKALGSTEVRQALNYAIDRPALAKLVWGKYAVPSDVPTVVGQDGYAPSLQGQYTYDPAKAKQMLASAGYPNGFTMSVNYLSFDTQNATLLQAMQSELAAVGVKLTLVPESTPSALVQDWASLKVAASATGSLAFPASIEVPSLFLSTATMNPYHSLDPTVLSAYSALLTAHGTAAVDAAAVAVTTAIQKDALAIPVAEADTIVFVNPDLKNVTLDAQGYAPQPQTWSW